MTTCDEATEISGRGIGLGAVLAACRAAGGDVEVETTGGKGTVFRFVFPDNPCKLARQQVAARPMAALS
jgi:two-component system, chemotaxis family, sensor kinase CheA